MFNLSQLRVLGLASQSRRSGTLRTDFSATPISSSWQKQHVEFPGRINFNHITQYIVVFLKPFTSVIECSDDNRFKGKKVCPLRLSRSLLQFICQPQLQRSGLRKTLPYFFYYWSWVPGTAVHTFLSYGVSLSGIWKYEREIQKVEKYPLWKEYLRPFQFPCESRCYDPTPRRESSPHGGVLKSPNCGEE